MGGGKNASWMLASTVPEASKVQAWAPGAHARHTWTTRDGIEIARAIDRSAHGRFDVLMNSLPFPHHIDDRTWAEIAAIPLVAQGYGIESLPEGERGAAVAASAYGAAFPGGVYLVQDDAFGAGALTFVRDREGRLALVNAPELP